MSVADLIITSVETVTGFDTVTGDLRFVLDELQNVSIANTEEKEDITGKGGRKLSSLKRNKGVTISGTSGLLSGGLLEVQVGGTFENKAAEVMWVDYLTVSSNAATTSYTAVGTSGAEIEELYIRNTDGTLGDKLEQGSTAASGVFTYNTSTKALAFSGVDDDTEIVVYYKRNIQADVLDNNSDSYSEKATLYIDALAEDKCNNVYRVQFFIPKADFTGEFTIEMGDSQATHEFEAESLSGACVSGSANLLWTYTVFGVNAEDAA